MSKNAGTIYRKSVYAYFIHYPWGEYVCISRGVQQQTIIDSVSNGLNTGWLMLWAANRQVYPREREAGECWRVYQKERGGEGGVLTSVSEGREQSDVHIDIWSKGVGSYSCCWFSLLRIQFVLYLHWDHTVQWLNGEYNKHWEMIDRDCMLCTVIDG